MLIPIFFVFALAVSIATFFVLRLILRALKLNQKHKHLPDWISLAVALLIGFMAFRSMACAAIPHFSFCS